MSSFKVNKTCYINAILQGSELKKCLLQLLHKGYCHFYLPHTKLHTPVMRMIVELAKTHHAIKLFVTHACDKLFWQISDVINLPITLDEDEYLRKYCDFVLE